MHISITVRDQILLIVSPCAAHVRMTPDVICHICSNLIEVDSSDFKIGDLIILLPITIELQYFNLGAKQAP